MSALNTEPSFVVNCNVVLALCHSRSDTPSTAAVEASVIRPSSSTVITGIAEEPPYCPAVTAVLASSAVIDIDPLPKFVKVVVPVPVTLPVNATSICGSGIFVVFVKSR